MRNSQRTLVNNCPIPRMHPKGKGVVTHYNSHGYCTSTFSYPTVNWSSHGKYAEDQKGYWRLKQCITLQRIVPLKLVTNFLLYCLSCLTTAFPTCCQYYRIVTRRFVTSADAVVFLSAAVQHRLCNVMWNVSWGSWVIEACFNIA